MLKRKIALGDASDGEDTQTNQGLINVDSIVSASLNVTLLQGNKPSMH